jgi:hypothetical protein
MTAHTKVFQVIEGRNIPDWKKFLSVKENKQALINFVGDFIVKFNQSNPLVPPGNLYYIAGSFGNPEIVKVVSDQEVFDCPDLYSTQEEADTRMILQALHADKRLKELGKQGRIIIKTSDTDVIVLCIYFYKQMKTPVNCGFKWETLLVLRTVAGFYLFMNYVLLSQKSHVEFFLPHMLSLGVTLPLPSLELAKSQCTKY